MTKTRPIAGTHNDHRDAPIQRRAAIVLLSGGLDSATCLAWARRRYTHVVALSFDYHQRHRAELSAADRVARSLHADRHVTVSIDLSPIGGSALTDNTIDVPKSDQPVIAPSQSIPITYVPARNMLFLSVAVGLAEAEHADAVVIGVNSVDYSGYPDCRPEFIHAFAHAATLGTRRGVEQTTDAPPIRFDTPIIHLAKPDIIRMGSSMGVDFAQTVSCYDATHDGLACARCDSCRIRAQAFRDANIPDPTRYTTNP